MMQMTQQPESKRFYRSTDDKMVAGVCGGLAKYFNIDPVIVRLATVLIALYTGGTAIIAYIAMVIIVPKQPSSPQPQSQPHSDSQTGHTAHARSVRTASPAKSTGPILDKK